MKTNQHFHSRRHPQSVPEKGSRVSHHEPPTLSEQGIDIDRFITDNEEEISRMRGEIQHERRIRRNRLTDFCGLTSPSLCARPQAPSCHG